MDSDQQLYSQDEIDYSDEKFFTNLDPSLMDSNPDQNVPPINDTSTQMDTQNGSSFYTSHTTANGVNSLDYERYRDRSVLRADVFMHSSPMGQATNTEYASIATTSAASVVDSVPAGKTKRTSNGLTPSVADGDERTYMDVTFHLNSTSQKTIHETGKVCKSKAAGRGDGQKTRRVKEEYLKKLDNPNVTIDQVVRIGNSCYIKGTEECQNAESNRQQNLKNHRAREKATNQNIENKYSTLVAKNGSLVKKCDMLLDEHKSLIDSNPNGLMLSINELIRERLQHVPEPYKSELEKSFAIRN